MKKLFYFFLIVSCAAVATSCRVARPLSVGPSDNNRTYDVEYLFEHDGCRVYRFYDHGNYVYFTNCTGNVTAISNDSIRERTYMITERQY